VDQKKFMALKTGLQAGFGAPVDILTGGEKLLDPGGSVAPDSVNLAGAAGSTTRNPEIAPLPAVDPAAVARLVRTTQRAQVAEEVENLRKARRELERALARQGLQGGATFRFDRRGLIVTVATDRVLFASGSADLLPGGRRILDALHTTLLRLPNQLSIDGHTNRLPIRSTQFPSNWELSTDRATGVLRYLATAGGIPGWRMSATGYADTRPLLPHAAPRALVVNRRVEIVIMARVDDSTGRTVAQLGNAGTTRVQSSVGAGNG
jgi:chemotaxis protein MotB